MPILTDFQKKIIAIASETPSVKEKFWLAGGTALAEFYLQHRLSEDLDFFTDQREEFRAAIRDFEETTAKKHLAVTKTYDGNTFARFIFFNEAEPLKVEFCWDSPYRFQPTTNSEYGIRLENPVDIACNKLSALYDRYAPKDFVDGYFIHREMHNLDDLICWSKQKHGGMDNYMLAVAFKAVDQIPDDSPLFPRMLKPLDKKDMRETFLKYAVRLIREPFEARPYSQ
ncbi:MAG: nucleotidyl transferase AbiEii/AbiGii toxin family protein [Candidatus Woesearchaeota archaeon]|nr:nucleotidyl transferase AbiEii/AbiGii toxin family protein [Candidatus Woesearchaeota archaeon]